MFIGVDDAVYRLDASKISRITLSGRVKACVGVIKEWGKYLAA